MAERKRFMWWIYFTQFLLISYEVKVQAWNFMMPCSRCATVWPTRMMIRHLRSAGLQPSLAAVVFNHRLLPKFHWLSQLGVLQDGVGASWDVSQGVASSRAQTCHLLSYTYIISDLTKMLLCLTLLLLTLKPNQSDDTVIIPSLKLPLVMDFSNYI